jgi:hypothetical protein
MVLVLFLNSLQKDLMRDDCVPTIVEFFYSVLIGNNESLVKMTLGCLKNYIGKIIFLEF